MPKNFFTKKMMQLSQTRGGSDDTSRTTSSQEQQQHRLPPQSSSSKSHLAVRESPERNSSQDTEESDKSSSSSRKQVQFSSSSSSNSDKRVKSILKDTTTNSKSSKASSSSSSKKRSRDSTSSDDKGKRKKRKTSQKMYTRVSSDLTDENRFLELLKIIGEHTKKAYCREHTYLSDLHDRIFTRLHQFAKDKVPRHYAKEVIPNEKNMALKAKEQVLQCLITRLEAEEHDWNKIKSEMEQNADNERYLEIDPGEILASIDKQRDASTTNGDEPESYNEQTFTSALSDVVPFHKKMYDLMIKTSMDIDVMNMCSSEIAQLQQIAVSHARYLELKQKEEAEESVENLPLLYEFGDPKKLLRDMQNDDEDSNDVRDE